MDGKDLWGEAGLRPGGATGASSQGEQQKRNGSLFRGRFVPGLPRPYSLSVHLSPLVWGCGWVAHENTDSEGPPSDLLI